MLRHSSGIAITGKCMKKLVSQQSLQKSVITWSMAYRRILVHHLVQAWKRSPIISLRHCSYILSTSLAWLLSENWQHHVRYPGPGAVEHATSPDTSAVAFLSCFILQSIRIKDKYTVRLSCCRFGRGCGPQPASGGMLSLSAEPLSLTQQHQRLASRNHLYVMKLLHIYHRHYLSLNNQGAMQSRV